MLESTEGIIKGLRLLMRAVGAPKGVIGIEANKHDAIEAFKMALTGDSSITVIPLLTRYPQGEERLLIQAATGKEVPSGGLPIDSGVIVDNVGTALAVYDSIKSGMPVIQRVLTVTGDGIVVPKNLLVKIGTPFSGLIEACGGFRGEPGKIVSGGPMMGVAVHSSDVPVTKGTSGILVIPKKMVPQPKSGPCLRCARCVDACPYSLMPLQLAAYAKAEMLDEALAAHIMDCKECGCCSYVCPSKIDIVQTIRMGKAEISRNRQRKTS
jgi:electron transport complex protein RnfC